MDDPLIVTRVRLYIDAAGEYRWSAHAGNEKIVADAGEGYTHLRDALRLSATYWPNALVKDEATGRFPDTTLVHAAYASL